jgi:hypothetical protein
MNSVLEKKNERRHNNRIFAGVILILLGATVLLERWFDIGMYAVLLLGIGMLTWGCVSRRTGWIIPGGVLSGIGLGILVMNGPWKFPAVDQNGIFLLCFALGWFLITLLTALFACAQWWALVPGGIMALVGGSLLVTKGAVRWADLNLIYAGLLILGGLALLASRGRTPKDG